MWEESDKSKVQFVCLVLSSFSELYFESPNNFLQMERWWFTSGIMLLQIKGHINGFNGGIRSIPGNMMDKLRIRFI